MSDMVNHSDDHFGNSYFGGYGDSVEKATLRPSLVL